MAINSSLITHDNFRAAVADYCNRMTEPAVPGWPIRKFLNQLDRYYACYVLIGLFYAGDDDAPAATLARLQAESRLSPRQTATLVQTLSTAGLIAVESDARDRRQKVLRPQPELIREVGRSCACFVAAFDRLTGQDLSRELERSPDALGRLIARSRSVIRQSDTVIAAFPRVFAAAGFDCGYQLLVGVMAGHYAEGPTHRVLTYKAMAERFQVSPSHVANVFAHFRKHGIIAPEKSGAVRPDFCAEFEQWCAAEMQHYAKLMA